MPHRLEGVLGDLDHALIVLRDLRRCRSALIAPGTHLLDDEMKAIDDICAAIKKVESARGRLEPRPTPTPYPLLITECLRQLDWRRTKELGAEAPRGPGPTRNYVEGDHA